MGNTEIELIGSSSNYLATLLRNRPPYVEWLQDRKNLYRRYPLTELYRDLQQCVSPVRSFGDLLVAYREFKQRHFLRIAGRDRLGLADLVETTSQLSDLACVALQAGLEALSLHPHWWVGEGEGGPWSTVSREFDITVLGLGKLGGQELNFVSDVDLIFIHSPKKEEAYRSPEALNLLSRLCHFLTRLLADRVNGDRVFEVDLRLRPQGKDGPVITSLAAAADHYLLHGHAWERQMLLKARPVAGARSTGAAFIQDVRPFVFRRFLDFQALDELRSMRDRIIAEGRRLSLDRQKFDVKLGIGGIREIEFLVQSLQLIYGGRMPELDEPNTLRCLDRLRDLNLLSADVVAELKESYVFLRRVEHWIQLDQNRQTQKLPQSEEARRRLCRALGFDGDEQAFQERLKDCCGTVHMHFLALFESEESSSKTAGRSGESEAAKDEDPLRNYPPQTLIRLQDCLERFPPSLRQVVRESLESFSSLEDGELAERILLRLERYFGKVTKRPGLMRVFRSSSPWVQDVCRALCRSELVADLLGHHPGLVEGVATAGGVLGDSQSWEAASTRLLRKVKSYEEGLEWIRRLKNERFLQLVLSDLKGEFPYEKIEGELTFLADFVLRMTYDRIKDSLGLGKNLPLSVLALGKLGSREMSYLSDLDLVFVYQPGKGESEEQIPGDVVRFVQRFMRMLSTPLHEGPGYAVDARLRPTGTYGPLIVTRGAWMEYFTGRADLWEVQALLRVRHVAGDEDLGRWIEGKACKICYCERNPEDVRQRLCHLRGRMQRERSDERGDMIDLKLGIGGLADVEFLVQGIQLILGHMDPDLQKGSVRIALPAALKHLPELQGQVRGVQAAYDALRSLDHRLRLHVNHSSARLSPGLFESMIAFRLWPPAREGGSIESWEDILRLRRVVRSSLQHFCPEI